MAATALLNAVDADTVGSFVAMTGPTTIHVIADSDDFGGGTILVEFQSTTGLISRLWETNHEAIKSFDLYGAYSLRATLSGAISPTNVSVVSTNGP